MKAIIITDGTESIQSIAKSISDSLSGFNAAIIPCDKFMGNDLLPADVFFIGCENPNPDSFSYLEKLLLHINLASRKCGIFSTKEKTIKYLKSILNSCEAEVRDPLIINNEKINSKDINRWLKGLLK
ncbi:MAG: hypothetical protein LBU66_04385 [Treponema sp.]|jgi:hypothetical protein|nr:hypothetical protein [Treponema sp.]